MNQDVIEAQRKEAKAMGHVARYFAEALPDRLKNKTLNEEERSCILRCREKAQQFAMLYGVSTGLGGFLLSQNLKGTRFSFLRIPTVLAFAISGAGSGFMSQSQECLHNLMTLPNSELAQGAREILKKEVPDSEMYKKVLQEVKQKELELGKIQQMVEGPGFSSNTSFGLETTDGEFKTSTLTHDNSLTTNEDKIVTDGYRIASSKELANEKDDTEDDDDVPDAFGGFSFFGEDEKKENPEENESNRVTIATPMQPPYGTRWDDYEHTSGFASRNPVPQQTKSWDDIRREYKESHRN